MKKSVVFIGGILLAISGMLAYISPDKLSLAVVSIMGVIVMLGFVFGIIPLLQYIGAFKQGTENLEGLKKINSDNLWVPLARIEPFFGQKKIDDMFSEYIEKAAEQREQGVVISDIENVINDDSISVRSWRGVVLQIAGTLTALGLLGTFLGLATGISGVKYGSLEAVPELLKKMKNDLEDVEYLSENIEKREKELATVRILKIFHLSNGSDICGCIVEKGTAKVGAKARVFRGKELLFNGEVRSLRHLKDDVREVRAGMECGIRLDNFADFDEGDTIQLYEIELKKQTL